MEEKLNKEFERIGIDEPIDLNKGDLFGTKAKADYIAKYIKENWDALKINNAIAIKGSWGYGKSSIIKTWKDNNSLGTDIELNEVDSWRYEGDIDLKLTLVHEIYKDGNVELLNKLKNALIRYTMSLKNRAKSYAADKTKYNLEDATTKQHEMEEIEKYIQQLSSGTNKKRVIVVDNVDRMSPANLVKFINSIKYLFSLFAYKDIVFVVLIDEDYMVHSFREFLKLPTNKVHEYIDKIFVRTFEVVPVAGIDKFKMISPKNLAFIDFALDSNPRMILKFINYYQETFAIEELISDSFDITYKIFLSCLKVKNPIALKRIISHELNWIDLVSYVSIEVEGKSSNRTFSIGGKHKNIYVGENWISLGSWISCFIVSPQTKVLVSCGSNFRIEDLRVLNPSDKILNKLISELSLLPSYGGKHIFDGVEDAIKKVSFTS